MDVSRSPGARAGARAALVGVALCVLLAVVAVASGARGRGASSADPRALPLGIFDYIYTLGVLTIVLAAVALLVLRPSPRRGQAPFLTGFFRTLLFLLVITALGSYAIRRGLDPQKLQQALQQLQLNREPAAEDALARKGGQAGRQAEFRWELAVVVGGLAGAGVLALVLGRRRPARALRERAGVAEELAAVLDETLDDLRAEQDARRAVIAAYARMERTLAASGVPRRPAEAPLEYLGRVLRSLSVRAEAALDLTALFERAKFSPHAIDASMKDDAIAGLVSVRDDLRMAA